jgi:hypothetical protein
MTLPSSVARCPGQITANVTDAWPFPREMPDCLTCARRTQGIADYMAGAKVEWMKPPLETPCPEKLAHKQKREANA